MHWIPFNVFQKTKIKPELHRITELQCLIVMHIFEYATGQSISFCCVANHSKT